MSADTDPQVADIMERLCRLAGGQPRGSETLALAAVGVFSRRGFDAETVLLRAVTYRVRPGEPGARVSMVGGLGQGQHVAVRCGSRLLDLAAGELYRRGGGRRPGPLTALMDKSFWSSESTAVLSGEDGSTILLWRVPTGAEPAGCADFQQTVAAALAAEWDAALEASPGDPPQTVVA